MSSFFECLTPDSKDLWKVIMQAFDCRLDVGEKQLPIETHGKLEDLSDIQQIMTTVPGFDRSEE